MLVRGSAGRSILFFVTVLLLLSAVPVFSRDGSILQVEQLLERGSFTERERRSLQRVFDSARNEEIPLALLVPRLQEGIAKRVDAARIERAIRSDVSALVTARTVAWSVPGGEHLLADEARWSRAATYLAAGRSPEELRSLLAITAARPERFRAAATLDISLADWGLGDRDVQRVVEAAVASRLEPRSYRGIAELFVLARRERVRPERMVDRVVAGLERAGSIGELRALVIE